MVPVILDHAPPLPPCPYACANAGPSLIEAVVLLAAIALGFTVFAWVMMRCIDDEESRTLARFVADIGRFLLGCWRALW